MRGVGRIGRRAAGWTIPLALVALVTGGPSACTSKLSSQIRKGTYPPDFNYVPQSRLESTMWQLARQVAELDRLMRDSTTSDEARQLGVIRELQAMQRVTEYLGPGGWPSNHPRISRHIDQFRDEVASAQRAAERSPPSYFLAGSISGACMHCHGSE